MSDIASGVTVLEGFLTETELAKELGFHRQTLAQWRREGIGPPFLRIGRKPRYSVPAVRKWLEAGGSKLPPKRRG